MTSFAISQFKPVNRLSDFEPFDGQIVSFKVVPFDQKVSQVAAIKLGKVSANFEIHHFKGVQTQHGYFLEEIVDKNTLPCPCRLDSLCNLYSAPLLSQDLRTSLYIRNPTGEDLALLMEMNPTTLSSELDSEEKTKIEKQIEDLKIQNLSSLPMREAFRALRKSI